MKEDLVEDEYSMVVEVDSIEEDQTECDGIGEACQPVCTDYWALANVDLSKIYIFL